MWSQYQMHGLLSACNSVKVVAILSLYQGKSSIKALRGCHDSYDIFLASKQHNFILTVLEAKSLKPLCRLSDRLYKTGNSSPQKKLFLIVWFPLTRVRVTPVFTPIFTWSFPCLWRSSSVSYKDLEFVSVESHYSSHYSVRMFSILV